MFLFHFIQEENVEREIMVNVHSVGNFGLVKMGHVWISRKGSLSMLHWLPIWLQLKNSSQAHIGSSHKAENNSWSLMTGVHGPSQRTIKLWATSLKWRTSWKQLPITSVITDSQWYLWKGHKGTNLSTYIWDSFGTWQVVHSFQLKMIQL